MIIYLILGLISLLFFIAYLSFSSVIYFKEKKEKYFFRNHFPYEMRINKDRPYALANLFLIISLLFYVTNNLYFAINDFSVNTAFLAFYSLIAAISTIFVFYTKPYNIRNFLFLGVIISILTALSNFQFVFIILNDINFKESVLYIPSLILSICLGIVSLIGSFFIRLDDLKMNKEDKEIVRPNKINMAVYEWIIIFIIFISQINLILYNL